MNTPPAWLERATILLGATGMERLHQAHVVVAGLGGVGGQCADALARAGIGKLTLIDNDTVTPSNLNRQLVALRSTIGTAKVDVMRARIADINPECRVSTLQQFLIPDNIPTALPHDADFIIDCIDTVPSKLALLVHARQQNLPIAASMGAGNRLDPSQARLTDISQTHGCALARIIRQGLRKQGIHQGIPVVWSSEAPRRPRAREAGENRPTNGTISYLPPLFGLMLASAAIRHLLSEYHRAAGMLAATNDGLSTSGLP